MVCSYATCLVAYDWDRIVHDSVQAFSRDSLVWLGATWLILKFVHEAAHGIACKKFGGVVPQGGLLFLLLIPLPFVDVTSSWKFGNKSYRILTSAAGMLAEVFLAAIAAIAWLQCEPGALQTALGNVMIAASVHTLLFNANPLLRFDGYHILADGLEIPNLGNHASRWFHGIIRSIVLGVPRERFGFSGARGLLVRTYGILSFLWKTCLLVTLSIGAMNLLSGIGLLLGLTSLSLWVLLPTAKFLYRLCLERREHLAYGARERIRFVFSCLLVVGLGYQVSFLPGPTVVQAPFVVDYKDLSVVRTESPGFLEQLFVHSGEFVQEGQPLFQMSNEESSTQRKQLQAELEAARIRGRVQKSVGNISRWQFELEKIIQLDEQLAELESTIEKFTVRATRSGVVIGSELNSKLGQFYPAGEEILSIGDERSKEAVGLVAQLDSEDLSDSLGSKLSLKVWGHQSLEAGSLQNVNPKSRDDIPHFSFAGLYGGPLQVVERNASEGNPQTTRDEKPLKLVASRTQVTVGLDADTSQRLWAGQSGVLYLRSRNDTLGAFITDSIVRWVKSQIRLNHGL